MPKVTDRSKEISRPLCNIGLMAGRVYMINGEKFTYLKTHITPCIKGVSKHIFLHLENLELHYFSDSIQANVTSKWVAEIILK